MPTVSRGAIPSSRAHLAAAMPHLAVTPTPPQFLWNPKQISMWGNDVNGDCVTAEEAFAKACFSPEIFIPDAEVIAWATQNNALNGASLTAIMAAMQSGGFPLNGKTCDDGPYTSVNWTNDAILQNAISTGPVKIGIAADQLETVYQANPATGWIAMGFAPDDNEDHCVSLCGYGTVAWLLEQLGCPASTADGTLNAYALFTWGTIGLIDSGSLKAICGEAWLRNPTTRVV